MDMHQEGRQLVEDIIRGKRIRMFLEGTPECEACLFPWPGICLLLCRQGCRHYLCPVAPRRQRRRSVFDLITILNLREAHGEAGAADVEVCGPEGQTASARQLDDSVCDQ